MTPGNILVRGIHENRIIMPVGTVKNNAGSTDDLQESKRADRLRERDSDLSGQFKLAHRALVLVSRGASEREAVQRAGASDPRLPGCKLKCLALLLGTVSGQAGLTVLGH